MRHTVRLLSLLLGLLCLMLPHPARAGWQTFTTSDGLAHNQVDDILEDPAGGLWFGTRGGLTHYDGVRWVTYTADDGMSDSRVSFVCRDLEGNIWCGADSSVETPGGVSRFDGRSWVAFTEDDGLADEVVRGFLVDRDGNVWVGTDGGLCRFDGEGWTTLFHGRITAMLEDSSGELWFGTDSDVHRFDGADWATYDLGPVRDVFEDHAGDIWVATGANWEPAGTSGVKRFDGVGWTSYTSADGLAYDNTLSIEETPDGVMWFGTWRGLSRFDGETWTTYFPPEGGEDWSRVSLLFVDQAGDLWVRATSGESRLARYDGTRWTHYDEDDGLAYYYPRTVFEDRVGNMWFGTERGASRFDRESWTNITADDGLGGDEVSSIAEDHAGAMWFGTDGGVSRLEGGEWTTFTEADGLGDDTVMSLFEDDAGRIWAGTEHGGVSVLEDSVWTTYGVGDGPPDDTVWCITQDWDGNLWFGTNVGDVGEGFGAARFDGDTWTVFTKDDGLIDNNIFWILVDRTGDLWFATRGGVTHYDGSTWVSYTVEDGLAYHWVTGICQDRSGAFWFSTYFGGVSRFDGDTWTTFTSEDGLGSDLVISCMEDSSGCLWFGTESGATRYDGEEWITLTDADGLVDNFVWPIHQDARGTYWFGTYGGGVSAYEPDRVPPRTVFLGQLPSLLASRQLDASFIAAFNETRVEFSHSLDDAPWSSWSVINTYGASGLSDGEHAFRVRARDRELNVEPTPATWAFEVDATAPGAVISSPVYGEAVRGTVVIEGSAADDRFALYRLQYRRAGAASWESPEATVIEESSTAVSDGALAVWDATVPEDGEYELRLSVEDTLGLVGSVLTVVVVDNEAPWAWETTPVVIEAASGGDVYTTNREALLYFPPRALVRDALVTVALAEESSVPDSLEGGAHLVLAGYGISWEGVGLRKPVTLRMMVDGDDERTKRGDVLAFYVLEEGQDWRRLGGTVEPDGASISAPITSEGTYAIFSDSGGSGTGGGLSALSFTPRVFSPSGSFADTEVGISFTIGRASPVTVKVYNRAGRLVDEVAANLRMNAGANIVRWDGRDRDGSEVPDGLYLVTVEALGEKQTSSLAVVR